MTTREGTLAVKSRLSLGVVLLEEDPERQSLLTKALSRAGSRVVSSATSRGALSLLKVWPADVLIVSSSMPCAADHQFEAAVRRLHPYITLLTASDGALSHYHNQKKIAHISLTAENPDKILQLIRQAQFASAKTDPGTLPAPETPRRVIRHTKHRETRNRTPTVV